MSKNEILEIINTEFEDQVGRGEILQSYYLWEKEGMHRVRVNIRDAESWKVVRSFFVKIDALNGNALTIA